MKIFVDDKRDFSEVQLYGYNCVRTYKQCITLLSVFKDIDLNTNKIDKNKCIHEFEKQYKNQNETIEYIQMNQIKVMNSGIKVN